MDNIFTTYEALPARPRKGNTEKSVLAVESTTDVGIQLKKEYGARVQTLNLPRYHEIPNIDLYMDQLLGYVEAQLGSIVPGDERLLTASMVNNYVKQKVIPQPQAKRYTRDYVAYLVVVCMLKQTFSLSEILQLISIQIQTFETPHAYDFFCTAFEESMRTLFCGDTEYRLGDVPVSEVYEDCSFSLAGPDAHSWTFERRLVIAAANSAAYKIYVQKNLEFMA